MDSARSEAATLSGTVAGLRSLVRDLERQAISGVPLADGSELILDADIDGMRCVLIRRGADGQAAARTLSPREHEIARMVAKGYPNKTIASVLEISTWTVGTHLRRIFAKLGVTSRAAMVARLAEEATPTPAGDAEDGRRSRAG